MRHQTWTSDSADGVRTLTGKPWTTSIRSEILLRHLAMPYWCGTGGAWVEKRAHAVRFATNLDALVYCQVLGLSGVIVAFDCRGGQIYELNVDNVLEVISTDPQVRSLMVRQSGGSLLDVPGVRWPLSSNPPLA